MPIELKKTYEFATLAPTQLGGMYKNMKVEAIMDASTAQKYRDVEGIHESILPLLPAGTPVSTSDITFYKFRTPEGNTEIFADAWIDSTTVTEVTSITIDIKVYNASTTDINRIREALALMNFTTFSITTS